MKANITMIILVFSIYSSFSQKRVADKFFSKYAYIKAAEFYEKAVKKGDSSTYVLTRLAECYYNNSNPNQAIKWYDLAAQQDESLADRSIYKYVQSLRSVGAYEKADQWLKKIPNAKQMKLHYNKLKLLNNDSVRVSNLEINTKNSDFGTYIHHQKFIFASTKNKSGKIYKWNNEPYLDLYEAAVVNNGATKNIINVTPIKSSEINTNFHESSIAITNDGKTMYFTRNNLNKRDKIDYDKEGTSHLRIFRAKLINGKWSQVEDLSINNEVYSNGHPALSPDNKTLYFASNRSGGFGLTDIYSVTILPDGSFGTPKNMGSNINTKGREMFPFVSKNNTFYFSSDGHDNLGFLDIFKVNLTAESLAAVQNMGAPFNSGYDDFAFFMNDDHKTGYFSSNRPGGKGKDDIYSFTTYNCKQFIEGNAFDIKTNELLENALVALIDENGKILKKIRTQKDGAYFFEVACEQEYTLRASKKDYKDDLQHIVTGDIDQKKIGANVYLTPLIIDNEIVIAPIFFDFDKWDIRPDAAFELENVVNVLRNHPKMILKIEAHTDSRGNDAYNEILSDRRAKATRDYILSRNIESHRIQSAIGYGEKQLVNKCVNNFPCSEKQHQENRRSKFIILNNYN